MAMITNTITAGASGRDTAEKLAAACAEARAAVSAEPGSEAAALKLFQVVSNAAREAAVATAEEIRRPPAEVARAAHLLSLGEEESAEILLRQYLTLVPNDPDAMLLMADIAMRCGFPENADKILRRSVELHPDRPDNLLALAKLFHHRAQQLDKPELVEDSLAHLDRLLALDPEHREGLRFKSGVLTQVRRLEEASETFRKLLAADPNDAQGWGAYAHVLKTLGQFGEAVAGFRMSLALDPTAGSTWSMLADMKLARFFASDIAQLETALEQTEAARDRIAIHFALGAAYHHAKDFEHAFAHLQKGNALRLEKQPHNIGKTERSVDQAVRIYSRDFFSAREGLGYPAKDAIFVVSLPRSGSTLVEQILSSHPAIEGTAELFVIQQMIHELRAEAAPDQDIDEIIAGVPFDKFNDLGKRYLDLAQFHRRTERPHFTDKNPGNWRHTALVHAMLPHAKIVDIRRNPMDCCFSNYSQHFAAGVEYSYGFAELASQYRQYVRLMRHFDAALPGKVHRIIYEDLVENTEAEVRRLLDYLELPFDDRCLRFFETQRAVHTPSSEQVRQPINLAGIDKWRHYEEWLGELKSALGATVVDWR